MWTSRADIIGLEPIGQCIGLWVVATCHRRILSQTCVACAMQAALERQCGALSAGADAADSDAPAGGQAKGLGFRAAEKDAQAAPGAGGSAGSNGDGGDQ